MPEAQRSFQDSLNGEKFDEDLQKYLAMALDLGADDAKIIGKEDVIIDERIVARCFSPRCSYYDTNLHCPPHSWSVEETRRIVDRYQKGIFILLKVPPEEMADPDYDNPDKHKIPGAMKMYKMVATIQSAAFYDGYPFALGFAGGPACKRVFCPKVECSGLTQKGCRMGQKVNFTMHGVGMDPITMASKVGWKVYPIGKKTTPDQIPYGVEMGLVLIQ
ncbi:MAG: hypothetical protein GX751_00215 [Desulfuromonadaceae bacterium]|nr:hypothetical protein [Desulfuromonadaceae bacterium]